MTYINLMVLQLCIHLATRKNNSIILENIPESTEKINRDDTPIYPRECLTNLPKQKLLMVHNER